MSKNINTPPKYCVNAVASKRGWLDPSTGELLVSNKSLDLDLISKTNNVIRTSLAPSMEEKNDEKIADLMNELHDDLIDESISGINNVSTSAETDKKDEIIDNIISKANMVETLHNEAGNSKTVFDLKPIVEITEDVINFDEMTNSELIKHANKIGAKVAKRDNKTKLIDKIKEHNEIK